MCFKYLLTIIITQKAMKNHQIRLPMSATNKWWSTLWCLDYGTGNKRLICNLLSQHRWWVSFILLSSWLGVTRKEFQFLWMLHTQVCELNLVFAFCLCTKLYPINEHFQYPVYAHFIVVGMWPNHFQSPYILLLSACVLEAVTQD